MDCVSREEEEEEELLPRQARLKVERGDLAEAEVESPKSKRRERREVSADGSYERLPHCFFCFRWSFGWGDFLFWGCDGWVRSSCLVARAGGRRRAKQCRRGRRWRTVTGGLRKWRQGVERRQALCR
jgi:hypothetical protein